ncbi:MAG: N-acetyltransferase DgcN [Planctomycetota bacterium]
MIARPYLLFLASARDLNEAKTAAGIARFRPEDCAGELAYDDCHTSTGLPRMSIEEAVAAGARTLVLGVAASGGALAPRWIETIAGALTAGLDIASGMHMRLRDQPVLAELAARHDRALHDVRIPPAHLPTGTGRPRPGRRVLTVGTDCSVGKMFTALLLEAELQRRGVSATFRATGQTGILIAGTGVPVDAVVADFLSGAVEQLAPAAENPDHWDVIEGQGSLFHPSFAGVSLGLLHGAAPDRMILCHDPTRTRMRGDTDHRLPSLTACRARNEDLARLTNPRARVVGIALNTSRLDEKGASQAIDAASDELGMPACDPIRTGVTALVDALLAPGD